VLGFGAKEEISSSVLQAKGLTNVIDLPGGFADWQAASNPAERGDEPVPGDRRPG
jgi:hypothetical protein